jgi:hypothetical protein
MCPQTFTLEAIATQYRELGFLLPLQFAQTSNSKELALTGFWIIANIPKLASGPVGRVGFAVSHWDSKNAHWSSLAQ